MEGLSKNVKGLMDTDNGVVIEREGGGIRGLNVNGKIQ